jgi:hypothetical protein
MLDRKEEAGMAVTKEWATIWQTTLRYAFSDQLHGRKIHKDWDWIIVNYIWPSMIQEIAKLSRNRQTIICNPWEDSDAEFAEAWQGILQWLWEKGINKKGMRFEHIRGIFDKKLFGYSISKVFWESRAAGWDDKKKEWIGDVEHKLWHPAEFWASDEENVQDGDCGTVRYVDLDWAIARWPNKKKELTLEASNFKDDRQTWAGDNIRGQLASAGTYPAQGKGGKDRGVAGEQIRKLLDIVLKADRKQKKEHDEKNDDKKIIRLSATYFRDYTTTSEKQEEDVPAEELIQNGTVIPQNGIFFDTDTGNPIDPQDWPKRTVREWKQPKYPNGRYVLRAGHTILADEPYPYKRWPFIVTPHYLLPHMWQGIDGVSMYQSAQDMINVSVSHLVNNLKQFGDPRIAVERGAVDSPKGRDKAAYKIGKGSGSVIRLVKGALSGKRFQILHPAPPSAAATQIYQIMAQEFKNIHGLQSVGRGEKEPGEMSATQAQHLAISSNDRIMLQSVFEDEWIRQTAQLIAEVVQRNYEPERFVRIIGQDQVVGIQQITSELKNIRFDVDVEAGTTLPYDEDKVIAKYAQAYAMMGEPVPHVTRDVEKTGDFQLEKTSSATCRLDTVHGVLAVT